MWLVKPIWSKVVKAAPHLLYKALQLKTTCPSLLAIQISVGHPGVVYAPRLFRHRYHFPPIPVMDEMFFSTFLSMEFKCDEAATSIARITWTAESETPIHVPGSESPIPPGNISITPENGILAPMQCGTSWMPVDPSLLAVSGTTVINYYV